MKPNCRLTRKNHNANNLSQHALWLVNLKINAVMIDWR